MLYETNESYNKNPKVYLERGAKQDEPIAMYKLAKCYLQTKLIKRSD